MKTLSVRLVYGRRSFGIAPNGGELAPFNRRLVGNGASLLLAVRAN